MMAPSFVYLGSSINHVVNFFDIFDPLPLLLNKAYVKNGHLVNPLRISCPRGLWLYPLRNDNITLKNALG